MTVPNAMNRLMTKGGDQHMRFGIWTDDNADPRAQAETAQLKAVRSADYAQAVAVDPVAVIEYELRAKLHRVPAVKM
jgi:hypothetical protein